MVYVLICYVYIEMLQKFRPSIQGKELRLIWRSCPPKPLDKFDVRELHWNLSPSFDFQPYCSIKT